MTERPVNPSSGDSSGGIFNRFTITLFGVSLLTGWFGYTLGPAVDIMRTEYGVSRQAISLLGAMTAVGGILAAFVAVRAVATFGRRRVIVGGAVVSAIGVGILVIGGGYWWALVGVLIASIARSLSGNAMTASITLHHGARSGGVLTHAHAVIAAAGIIAPIALGLFIANGIGWRPGFYVWLVLAALVAFAVWALPRLPVLDATWFVRQPSGLSTRQGKQSLGPVYRLLLVVMVAIVSAEWATVYWAADLIRSQLDVPASTGALGVSALLLGQFIGRIAFGGLARRFTPLSLMMIMFPLALVGWAALWAGPTVVVALAGAFVMGLGISATYPFLVTLMAENSSGQHDRAIAISGLATAMASGLAPFVLASFSDAFGPTLGFLFVLGAVLVSGTFAIVVRHKILAG